MNMAKPTGKIKVDKEQAKKELTKKFIARITITCSAKSQKEALGKFEATKVGEGVVIEGVAFDEDKPLDEKIKKVNGKLVIEKEQEGKNFKDLKAQADEINKEPNQQKKLERAGNMLRDILED